ncbi:MAG TPA: GNAT family N-acetyltransferase [Solirubrobacteraceae bacterium]|jgi:ribosomal protein S18 acetylase RimI-like enzyme|nr:GNAT family N-acetyltransferase [Solirubrobacteraceae bacterium]
MSRTDTPSVRRMREGDLGTVTELTAAAFQRELGDELTERRWRERIAHPFTTDPDGAFVAELDGRVIGVAEAIVRERLWVLSMFAVQPGIQSAGAGRMLLDHAGGYGRESGAGLIVSSNDPRALRLYASAGFALQPTLRADGEVDRRALPRAHPGIREEDRANDLESLGPLARAIRGAPYTGELRYALARGARLLRLGDRGFAVVYEDGSLWLLVASDEEAASALLWHALAIADGPTRVRWITGAQQWAIDPLVRARLQLTAYGALCVRGTPGTLQPFVPSVPFA